MRLSAKFALFPCKEKELDYLADLRNPDWLCSWAHNYTADGWWCHGRPPISDAALAKYKQWKMRTPRNPTNGVGNRDLKMVTAAAGLPTRISAGSTKTKSGLKRRDMHRPELVTQLSKIFPELDVELANGRGGPAPVRPSRERFRPTPPEASRSAGLRRDPGTPFSGSERLGTSARRRQLARPPTREGAGSPPACFSCGDTACKGKCEAEAAPTETARGRLARQPGRGRGGTGNPPACPNCDYSACDGKCEAPRR